MKESDIIKNVEKVVDTGIRERWTAWDLTAVGIGIMLQGLENLRANGQTDQYNKAKAIAERFLETNEMYQMLPGVALIQ